jgi:UTP--glucose-1-phosphate uridylyltransferase
VPRTRFAPVKTCDDLLGLRSDVYVLTPDGHVRRNPARQLGTLVVELDPRYYRLVKDFEARFPHGAPSLIQCEQLTVEGDVYFGRNVAISGQVTLSNKTGEQVKIPKDTKISQDLAYL